MDRREGTTKLVGKEGAIMREQLFNEGPISIRFRGAIISPSGEIQQVEVSKDGNVIGLTADQARSLAREIRRRLGE